MHSEHLAHLTEDAHSPTTFQAQERAPLTPDRFATIKALIADAANGAEGGKVSVYVAVDLLTEVERLRSWVNDLQSGMYVNCVYCGHRYGPRETTPATMADALKAHVERCPAHPMLALKAENERLRAALREAYPQGAEVFAALGLTPDPEPHVPQQHTVHATGHAPPAED